MVRSCVALLVLCFPIYAMAQTAFPVWGEVRLSEQACPPGMPPAIAFRNDGSGVVFWGSAAQQIAVGGTPVGANTPSYGYSGAAIAREDSSYALLSSERVYLGGQSRLYEYRYRLLQVDVSARRDSSPVLFTTSHPTNFPHAQDSDHEYSVFPGLFETPFGLHLPWNVLRVFYSEESGVHGRTRLGMDRWNPGYAWIVDEQRFHSPDPPAESMEPLPMAFHRLSDAWDGRRTLLLRRPSDPADSNDTTFVRVLYGLSWGGALVSEVVIDTVPARGTDLSTFPIVSPQGVDLLQRHSSGAVLVERVADDGSITDSLVLPIHVRPYNGTGYLGDSDIRNFDPSHVMLDLAGRRLQDGRVLLAWSATGSDDSADVYVGLFGTDWEMLGPPKRVNGVTAGHQYGMRLFVHDDTVSVAWLDNRDGDWHVYVRRFAIDRVLSIARAPVRASFSIEGPWPHPARGRTTFSLRGAAPGLSLRILDATGRIVWAASSDTCASFSVDLHGCPPGAYFLQVFSERERTVRAFIVR